MEDTKYWLVNTRTSILEANNSWLAFAEVVSRSYSNAYKAQQSYLNSVKAVQEARAKRERELMTLYLGIVTAGLFGPASGHIIDKMAPVKEITNVRQAISADAIMTKWVKSSAEELVKTGDEKLRELGTDLLATSVSEGPFTPIGIAPDIYASLVKTGILRRTELMSSLAKYMAENLTHISGDRAKALYQSITKSSFANIQAPWFSSSAFEAELTKLSEAMLWIAWLAQRDRSYWDTQQALSRTYVSEVQDWQGLVQIFKRIGIIAFTAKALSPKAPKAWQVDVVDMPKMISWAKGPLAVHHIMNRVPLPQDHKQAVIQMAKQVAEKAR